QILDVALDQFATLGYDAVSLRDLNRRLGASPAMLAKRFGTKDVLWRAAVEHGFAAHRARLVVEAAAAFAATEDDLERLRGLIAAFVRTAGDHPQRQKVINVEAGQDTNRVDHLFTECIEPLLDAVFRPLLDRLVSAGRARPISDREVFFLIA